VDTEIDAADADRQRQRRRDREHIDAHRRRIDQPHDQRRQRQVDHRAHRRVAAREARRVDADQLLDEVRTRPVICQLQKMAGRRAGDDRQDGEQRRSIEPRDEQVADDDGHDDRQQRISAERGQFRHELLEPRRAEWLGQVLGIAESQQQGLVEPVQFGFGHLVGDLDEGEDARAKQGDQRHRHRMDAQIAHPAHEVGDWTVHQLVFSGSRLPR
jgi:hypothetical protein